jgi:hypothetical protein
VSRGRSHPVAHGEIAKLLRKIRDDAGLTSGIEAGQNALNAGAAAQSTPLGRQPGDEEADLPGDCDRVVGEALVVAADQRGVDGRFHSV